MKFVLIVVLTMYYCMASLNQNGGGTVKNNVRHGRSRGRLLRNHVEEVVKPDYLLNADPFPQLTTLLYESQKFYTKTTSITTNHKIDEKNEMMMEAPYSTTQTQSNANKQSTARRITVDAANLSGNPNNSGQYVDKSVMYFGERALGPSGKKNDALTNKKKQSKSHANDLDSVETQSEDSLLGEEEMEGAQHYIHTGYIDIVTRFLRIVESQHLLGADCTAGTDLNLGEGVVDRYAQERFRVEANVAVNRANMLTRLWKFANVDVLSEDLLKASVYSMVEFDEDIFAAGNCYDEYQFKKYWLYCPYAYRLPDGRIMVKDLADEYKYLSNTSEWFFIARKNADSAIKLFNVKVQESNKTAEVTEITDEILEVQYEDGKWSKPYYDCGGGNIWMLTYTVPFFGFSNNTYYFKGTSGIDIDLQRVDIDQCPLPKGSSQLNIFAASDKCKKRTTECVPMPGLGFRRGSYKCVCRKGFYFPNVSAIHRYYNGTVIEEEYEKLITGEKSLYGVVGMYECLPCPEGCESCVDDRPCVVSLNWVMRSAILVLSCVIICCLPVVVIFTWKYDNVKVVRAASPVLLRVIILGAFFLYCTTIVMYPRPSVYTCTARIWLREIGFSLTYGALMLKTWRISVIFRVRSAKAVKITDTNLLKRLGVIVATFSVFLIIRTLVAPPVVIVGRTAEDLKAYLCRTDWWDHSFSILEVLFLVWGIRLCIMVRKAPSEFNESRFISMAIYNEFLLSIFLNVSMLFLQKPANPDLLYIIFFCHTQLTATLLLCLIFGSKAYMVFKGHDRSEESSGMMSKTQGSKFIAKARAGNSQYTSTNSSLGGLEYSKLTEQDVQEEFLRVYTQLELLKEKNMRIGNRHLVSKISAMQDAASKHDNERAEATARNIHKINTMICMVTDKLVSSINLPDETPPEPIVHHRTKGKRQSVSFACSADTFDGETITTKNISCIKEYSGPTSSSEEPSIELGNRDDLSESPAGSHNGRLLKSGHARTHAIVINLDDKSRFTEEVTV